MAKVEKDIKEESAKISKVKRIVKEKAKDMSKDEPVESPLSDASWIDLQFSHPQKTVRIGTLFSGIGAIEHAFQRLKLNHKIVVCCKSTKNPAKNSTPSILPVLNQDNAL